MNSAVRPALVAFTLLGGAVAARAEEPPARAISPRVAEVLRSTLPTYDEVVRQQAPSPKPPAQPVAGLETDPGVAALPRYIVKEGKLPTPEQVMSRRAIEEVAMNRYLGPKDGLDRGYLNAVTMKELWQKIPVIGKIVPFPIPSLTNAERAMIKYNEDLRVQRKNDLMELSTLAAKSGDPAQAKQIKRETERAFKNE